MGVISSLRNLLKTFTRSVPGFTTSRFSGGIPGSGWVMPRDTFAWLNAYKRNPRLRAAVRRIAKDVAKVKFHLQQIGPDGKPRSVPVSPFLLWKKQPWSMLRGGTWEQFVFLMVAHYVLVGNAYAIFRRYRGFVVEVIPIAPHLVLPVRVINGQTGEPEMIFQVTIPGEEIPVPVPGTEMFWWRDPDLSSPLYAGDGQAQCLDDEIELDEAAAKYNLSYFRNQATPHALVTVKGATPDQLNQIKADWRANYGGSLNKFRSAFTSQDVIVNELGQSQKDMEFVEGRRFSRDAIYQTFTLPPEIMGVVENSNRATAEAALYLYSLNVVLPHCNDFAAEVTRQILPELDARDGLVLGFENPVRETEEFKLKKATELFKAGAITRDECRVTNGYDPLGGDRGTTILVPTNTAPDDQAAMPAEKENDDDGTDDSEADAA